MLSHFFLFRETRVILAWHRFIGSRIFYGFIFLLELCIEYNRFSKEIRKRWTAYIEYYNVFDKFLGAETSTNSSCTQTSKSDSTSMKPLLVGISVLASTAFIIILLTLYAYQLEMRQQSRTEQKEHVWFPIMFISVTQYNNNIFQLLNHCFFFWLKCIVRKHVNAILCHEVTCTCSYH